MAHPVFTASIVSGPVKIKASSTGSSSDSATIEIGQWNLQELSTGAHYSLTGDIAGQHTQNHFGKAQHFDMIRKLADSYYAKFNEGPTFNDTSLPLGGLYDVDSLHHWSAPHQSHGEGRSTDFKTIGLDSARVRFVRRFWERCEKLGCYLGDETIIKEPGRPPRPNLTNPHYHLTFGPID